MLLLKRMVASLEGVIIAILCTGRVRRRVVRGDRNRYGLQGM